MRRKKLDMRDIIYIRRDRKNNNNKRTHPLT